MLVILTLFPAVTAGRDDHRRARRFRPVDDLIGVIAFVRD